MITLVTVGITVVLCVGIVAIAVVYWKEGYKAGREDSENQEEEK